MAITYAGRDYIAGLIIGEEGLTPFDNQHAYIGVGSSDAPEDPEHTDLQGEDKYRAGMSAGYPIRDPDGDGSLRKIAFRAEFGPGVANYAWNEWGIFNAETGGVMLNRVVESNGVKEAGQTWIYECELELVFVESFSDEEGEPEE